MAEDRPRADGAIFATSVGRGLPMLVMHGGMGLDHSYLRPGLDPLADGVRLVYYDHRGNGRSARPSTEEGWNALSHASWVADADALRASLGLEQVVILGHSYGGLLAQEYALAHPKRVAALILCSTFPSFAHAEAAVGKVAARATPAQLTTLLEAFGAPIAEDAAFAAAFRTVLPLYFHEPTPSRLQVFDAVRYSTAAFARAQWGCLPSTCTEAQLGEIDVPCLILAGAHDWIAAPEHGARKLQAGIPHADVVVFEHSGHFPFLEEPDAFARVVVEWLQRTEAVARSGGTGSQTAHLDSASS